MKFERVLAACLIGGAAASITWAYTAKGIIEFMERYHAEAFIPVIIIIIVVVAFLHVRTNKRRRKEALFRESMTFFRGTGPTELSDD
jgi:cytochrome bd-type quinol oxidase subunit 2